MDAYLQAVNFDLKYKREVTPNGIPPNKSKIKFCFQYYNINMSFIPY